MFLVLLTVCFLAPSHALVIENKNQRYWDVEGLLSQADWARYFDVLSLPQASASPLVRILRVNYLLGQYHNIEICTDKEFDDKQEAIVVLKEHNTEYNYPGKEGSSPFCFLFLDVLFPSDGEKVRYDVHVLDSAHHFGTTQYFFYQSRNGTHFNCGGEDYTRIDYDDFHVQAFDEICLGTEPLTCYAPGNGEYSNGTLCRHTTDLNTELGLHYCQPSSMKELPSGPLSEASLNYNGYMFYSQDGSSLSDVLLSVSGSLQAHRVSKNRVRIPKFERGTEIYTICALQLDSTGKNVTSLKTASIQDLDIGGARQYGEFNFYLRNLNPARVYNVSGMSGTQEVLVDCNRVPDKGACYGYVPAGDGCEPLIVDYKAGHNRIVVPPVFLDD